jgi:hypothetical protein
MKTFRVCAWTALFAAAAGAAFAAGVGPSDPPGWYLEGAGTRAGPFGSQGLCLDLARREAPAGVFACVHYDRVYWLVEDQGFGRTAALTPQPFASHDACLVARALLPQVSAGAAQCTRRTPTTRPMPGTA